MALAGAPHDAPVDFRESLHDRVNREWEEFVLSWFRDFMKRTVEDNRGTVGVRGYCDFSVLLGNVEDRCHPDRWRWETMDVKADKRCLFDRDNLFFEDHEISQSGVKTPGWGRKRGLDLLAYVSRATRQMFVVDVCKFRELVDEKFASDQRLRAVPNVDEETGRRWVTYGYPVPLLACLKVTGLVRFSAQLPRLSLDEAM